MSKSLGDDKKHTIKFDDIFGFTTPPDIEIQPTDSATFTGVYTNLLLDSIPPNCTPAGSLWVWGMPARPQRNGDIYNFINGPGQIYVDHGFDLVIKHDYRDTGNVMFFVEIYYMLSDSAAASLFNDSLMRSSDDSLISLGIQGMVNNPVPAYYIEFYRKHLYVRVHSNNDYSAPVINEFAALIDQRIQELSE